MDYDTKIQELVANTKSYLDIMYKHIHDHNQRTSRTQAAMSRGTI